MRSLLIGRVGVSRIALVALTGVILSACSGSVDRFNNYPNINTGSIDNEAGTSVADDAVRSQPLDNASIPQRPSWQQPANTQTAWQQPTAPQPSYQQPTYQQPTYQPPASQPQSNTAASTGNVRVAPGQTLYSIARANGTSVQRLASYNGISAPYTLKVGQVVRIPGVSSATAPAPSFQPRTQYSAAPSNPTPAPANTSVQARTNYTGGGTHTVAAGQTLFAVGRQYNMNPYTIARYNGLSAPYHLNAGQVLKIPGAGSTPVAQQQSQPATSQTAAAEVPALPEPVDQDAVKSESRVPQEVAAVEQSTPAVTDSGFRWPVRGRVISTYGQKPNGMRNEGINIAVPEGTSVRAAEAGVVAYAGNELKGYGNLVLIRHSNGWVSAYAHNKELFVKRGETVKRGDVIAKAGQTGSVTAPQLHFELRKGASAVDPMKYLGTSQAAVD